jgi:hypothetical protein
MTDTPYRLDVVGMVVGNQHVVYGTKAQTIVLELLFERPYTYTNIYYQTIRFGKEIVAIAAAAASKGYKF